MHTAPPPPKDLRLALVQPDTAWESPEKNRERLDALLADVQADLVMLPETFSTGFTMSPVRCAEAMHGDTLEWLAEKASKLQAVITGSLIVAEESRYFNRLVWVTPNGLTAVYDKRHLFGLMGEDRVFTPGARRVTVEVAGWRVRPVICYDLRFPVWCRNDDRYDVLFVAANWPAVRHFAWTSLLTARAIENQSYVVGINRAGSDPQGVSFGGSSLAIDPLGVVLERLDERPQVKLVTFSRRILGEVRHRFPFLKDQDEFSIS